MFIAEVGVNHNGKLENALKYVDLCKELGIENIKFQTYKTENLVNKKANLAPYQKNNVEESLFGMLKKYELSYSEFETIKKYCDKNKINFISSPFDNESLNFLTSLGVSHIKIPSGEINNYFLLDEVSKLNKKIILSTGMSTLKEVEESIKILTKRKLSKNKITILHCSSSYPASYENLNLRAIQTLKYKFNTEVGFSDHTIGYEALISALSLGATVIEKHITLNNHWRGPDHKASLNPVKLKEYFNIYKATQRALGDGIKIVNKEERINLKYSRKSIHAKTQINKGEFFSKKNLTSLRPGSGISPMKVSNLIGKKANRNYSAGEIIDLNQ